MIRKEFTDTPWLAFVLFGLSIVLSYALYLGMMG
jgi:hypothetical protein